MRYSYNIVVIDHRDNDRREVEQLNRFGAEGWELVAVTRFSYESRAYFRRKAMREGE